MTLGGCSGGSGPGGSGGTGLDAALANVPDTSAARAQVAYDDTAALVKLSRTSIGAVEGEHDLVTARTRNRGLKMARLTGLPGGRRPGSRRRR